MTDGVRHPAEPWALVEEGVDIDRLAQAESLFALSNGHIGLRGNLDEGEPAGLSGTYLNGFYESFPLEYGERGYGFAEDGQSVVNVTDGKIIRLQVEDEPLDVHRGEVVEHERRLDFRSGMLERRLHWRAASGHEVRLTTRRLVSLSLRSLAAIEYEVEAVDQPIRVAIQSNLQANKVDAAHAEDPRVGRPLNDALQSLLHVDHGMRVVLGHQTKHSGLVMASGMEHVLEHDGDVSTLTQTEPDLGRVTLSAELEPGRPLKLLKLLAYHWSSQQSVDWLRDQGDASLESGLAEGFRGLAEAQRETLERYWQRADVQVEGDAELQQALRFALFHIFQATARNEGRAIPAKGLTGSGYDGHAFWDTESFVLPVLTFTAPKTVRSALEWRHSTLDSARERARQLGLRGAALPWRTIHGEECSGYWPAGIAAFHVNAAVAAAVRRYVMVTDDREFEERTGCELLVESARLWASLGYHDDRDDFRIDGVTGPDEYSALVDNNVYTNLMAQLNLRSAVESTARHPETAARLGVDEAERREWQRAADAMYVPYDEERGLHPQDQDFLEHEPWDFEDTPPDKYPLLLHYPYFQLYRKQVVKQADLVMAMHWRGDAFTPEEKQRNFDYYERLTVRDSSLSACTQSVLAAEVGHLALARDYLEEAARMDLEDLAHNTADGLHMASLAGAVLAAVGGFGGVRDHGGRLSFRPRLPEGIERLCFSLEVRGSVLQVEIGRDETAYSLGQGTSLRFSHWDEEMSLEGGGAVRLPIPPGEDEPAPSQPPGREPRAGRSRRDWPRSKVEAHGGQGMFEAGGRAHDGDGVVAETRSVGEAGPD